MVLTVEKLSRTIQASKYYHRIVWMLVVSYTIVVSRPTMARATQPQMPTDAVTPACIDVLHGFVLRDAAKTHLFRRSAMELPDTL